MKTDTPLPNSDRVSGCVQRLVRIFRWNITNERTGDTCTYNAAHGIPVTEEHVRMSPKVREWANGDPIHVSPPNTPPSGH